MYSAKIDGERVKFGTSGLLYHSNKLMYDRKTNPLWRQFTGEPVVGPLAEGGKRLELFPVLVTTWGEWVTAHPDTTVLDIETGVYPSRAYEPETSPDSIYYDYFNSPDTMFPVGLRSDLLESKAVVLGLRIEGRAKAYHLERLVQEPVVNDRVGSTSVVVVTNPDSKAARAYKREGHQFILGPEGESSTLLDENGTLWQVTEEALISSGDAMRRLQRLPGHMAFWFGWFDSFPLTEVYGLEAGL